MIIFQISLLAILTLFGADSDETTSQRLKKERAAAAEVMKALGAEFSVTESYIRRSLIETETPYGFKIRKVIAGSPAARAGWKKGDILLRWNGRPVESVRDLVGWIFFSKRGAETAFDISRRKKGFNLLDRDPWIEVKGRIEPDRPV